MVMLFLKTLTGNTIILDVDNEITIGELKYEISKKININPKYIRLVWKGKLLGNDNLELNKDYDYNFRTDKGIHIIINYNLMREDEEYKNTLHKKQGLSVIKSFIDEQSLPSNMQSYDIYKSIIDHLKEPSEDVVYRTKYQDYDYDDDGYDYDGYDVDGYDRDGYDVDGYDIDGYDIDGYDYYGYDVDGFDYDGYDVDGFNDEVLDNINTFLDDIKGGKNNKKLTIKKR